MTMANLRAGAAGSAIAGNLARNNLDVLIVNRLGRNRLADLVSCRDWGQAQRGAKLAENLLHHGAASARNLAWELQLPKGQHAAAV